MTRQIVFFRAKESGKSYTKLLSLTDTHALKKKQNSLSQNRWRRGASPAYQRESSISPAYQGESSTALVNTHYGRGSGAEKREPSLDLSRRAFQAGRRRKNARKNTRPNDMPARTLTHSLRRGNKHTIMRARARGRGRQAAAILVSRPLRISTPTRACARLGKVFFFVEAGGGTVVWGKGGGGGVSWFCVPEGESSPLSQLNWAASVDPFNASVEEAPAETTVETASK